jgi:hypothetical protein
MPLAILEYGGRPVNNSMIVHAKDQISDLVEAFLSSITSGAIQLGETGTPSTLRSIMERRWREIPKSESLTFPVLVVRMFAALRS